MSDMHSFSVDVAKEVGVNAAILLQSIKWWCEKNRANGKNEHDGLYWTYNSIKAWQELYPYLGKSAISSALKRLEDGGYIRTGNYNRSAYDRTIWYAITDKGLSLFGECISDFRQMEERESGNGITENREPIPDTFQLHSTDSFTDIGQTPKKSGFNPPTREQVMAYVKEKGYHFDAQEFYDYYSSGNWCKGNGQKVKNWRQCCATWEGTWKKNNQPTDRRSQYTAEQNAEFDEYAWDPDKVERI